MALSSVTFLSSFIVLIIIFVMPTISAEAKGQPPRLSVWNVTNTMSTQRPKCPPSHIGNNCEIINPCFTGNGPRCFYNGTCEILWEKKRGAQHETVNFKCHCKLGYTNSLCETPTQDNACHNFMQSPTRNPCKNSATCRLLETPEQYVCDCRKGYAGRHCEFRDHCREQNSPCRNNATCTSSADTYTCQCPPGFTGRHCENDIDECRLNNPCENGAECINSYGSYMCQCKSGFIGKNCENIFVPCKPSPCQNGGECILDRHLRSQTRCQCPPGFQGEFCEINIDDCVNNQCANNATCVDGINNYTCLCPPEFTGPRCMQDVDECAWVGPPPGNATQCNKHGECTNRHGGYSCMCDSGWEGTDCEINVDDCAFNSCMNGGKCLDYVGFYRCECPAGKTGFMCHLDDPCVLDKPCLEPSKCVVNPVNGSYTCICKGGFRGHNCDIDIDECAAEKEAGFRPICEHGGKCVNTPGAFKCACTPGYNGSRCQDEINECAPRPCLNGGRCYDEVGRFHCECPRGFTGEKCELNVNECAGENPCKHGGVCVDGVGDFKCNCAPGFGGKTCEQNHDECETEPCRNGGTCVDEVNGYKCYCPLGFNGTRCEENINDCAKMPCLYGNCVDGVGNFTCECRHGYTGRLCDEDVDDCAASPCRNGGACIDQIGKFHCICKEGFTGSACDADVDECLKEYTVSGSSSANSMLTTMLGPCKRGTCRNTWGSYECDCSGTGYAGRDCDIDIDACRTTQNRCQNGGTCLGFDRCLCPPGYSGMLCEHQVNECAELTTINSDGTATGPCKHGGRCEDLPGSYQCVCPTGWSGQNCTINIDDCAAPEAVCQNGGKCEDLLGDYQCICPAGTLGKNCELNVDDCYPGACFHGGTCIDKVSGFDCICPSGFVGPRCEGDVDECLQSNCAPEGTRSCVQQVGQYRCVCLSGHTGRYCEIKYNTCDYLFPCYNGGRCELVAAGTVKSNKSIDLLSSSKTAADGQDFVCHCPMGFRGPLCQEKFDPCSSSGEGGQQEPCRNGGECFPSDKTSHGYECLCDSGYTGMHCQERMYGPNAPPPADVAPSSTNSSKNSNSPKTPFDLDPDRIRLTCPYADCVDKIHDGHCDQRCNSRDCAYDGGDCSLGIPNPWQNCSQTTSFPCWQTFDNGMCDPQCNTRECLYDGYDCAMHTHYSNTTAPKCPFENYCAQHYGDGHCDAGCNSEACGWDGFDCDTATPPDLLGNGISVFLSIPESAFRNYSTQFLKLLSSKLRSNVRIKRSDVNGEQMIRSSCFDDMLSSDKSSTCAPSAQGTMVVLDIDNRRCKEECFESPESVSQYLAALSSSRNLQVGLPMKLVRPYDGRFDGGDSGRDGTPGFKLTFTISCIVFIIVVSLLTVGMLHARQQTRKRVRATTWFPDDFDRSASTMRRGLGTTGAKNSGIYSTTSNANLRSSTATNTTTTSGANMRQRQHYHGAGQNGAHVISPLSISHGEFGEEMKNMRTTVNPMMDALYAEPMSAAAVAAQARQVSGYTESSTCDSIATTSSSAYAAGARDELYELQPPAAKRRRRAADDMMPQRNADYDDDYSEDDFGEDTLPRRRRAPAGPDGVFTPPNDFLLSPANNFSPTMPVTSPQTAQLIHMIESKDPSPVYRDPPVEIIFQLINSGAVDLQYKFEMCQTLLHEAARRGKLNIARALMHYSADPNAADKLGNTPLHVAIESDNRLIVQFLLSFEFTDVNARNYDFGATPLIMTAKAAGQNDLLLLLLQRGAKHDQCDNNGRSPLHWAAAVNNCEAIDLLCEHDAKIDMQNEDEATPLFLAAKEGNVDAVKMLLKKNANANQSDNMEQTPYDIALARKHHDVLDVLEAHKSTQFISGGEQVFYSQMPQKQQIHSTASLQRRNNPQLTCKLSTESSKYAVALAFLNKPNSAQQQQQQNVRLLQQQQQQQMRAMNTNTLPCRTVLPIKPSGMVMMPQRETLVQAAPPSTPVVMPTTPSSAAPGAKDVPFMFFGQSQPQQRQVQQNTGTGKRSRSDGHFGATQQQQLISPPLPSPRVAQQHPLPPMSAGIPMQPISSTTQPQQQQPSEFTWDCSPSSINSNGQNANGSTPVPPCGTNMQQLQQQQHNNQHYYAAASTAATTHFPNTNNLMSPPQYAPAVTSPNAASTSSSSSGRGSSIAQPLSVLNKATPPITSPLLMMNSTSQHVQQPMSDEQQHQPNEANQLYNDPMYSTVSNAYEYIQDDYSQQQNQQQPPQFVFSPNGNNLPYSYRNTYAAPPNAQFPSQHQQQQYAAAENLPVRANAAAQAIADQMAASVNNRAYYTQDYSTPSPHSPLKVTGLWTNSFSPSSNDDHSPLSLAHNNYGQPQQQQLTFRSTRPSHNSGGAAVIAQQQQQPFDQYAAPVAHQMLPSFASIKPLNGVGSNAGSANTKASYVHHGAPQPYASNSAYAT